MQRGEPISGPPTHEYLQLRPLCHFSSVCVGKGSDDYHNKINQDPNSEATKRKYLKDRSADFPGILHAKSMIVKSLEGDYAIIGSANWTVSSKANLEVGTLLRLRSAGLSQCLAQVEILRNHVEKFEAPDQERIEATRREWVRRAAERKLSRSLSRSSTR